MVPIKLWIFRFKSKQITNQKLHYVYISLYIYILFLLFTNKVEKNIYIF